MGYCVILSPTNFTCAMVTIKKQTNLWVVVAITILLSSCGSSGLITRTRYNNGLNLNISFRKADKDKPVVSANKRKPTTVKEQNNVQENETTSEGDVVNLVIADESTFEETTTATKYANTLKPLATTAKKVVASKPISVGAPKTGIVKEKIKKMAAAKVAKKMKRPMDPTDGTAELIIMILLCLIIPPLAILLYEGLSGNFWIDLLLFIIGVSAYGVLSFFIGWLALLAAVVFAFLVVFDML